MHFNIWFISILSFLCVSNCALPKKIHISHSQQIEAHPHVQYSTVGQEFEEVIFITPNKPPYPKTVLRLVLIGLHVA